MNEIITRGAAAELLQPYASMFAGCWHAAWQKWLDEPVEKRLLVSKRSRASLMSDYAHEDAAVVFEPVEGVTPVDSRGLVIYNVENRLLVRFKKLRPNLHPSNIRTEQQQLWAEQEPIPGMPPVTGIVMGYILNELETSIERVVFVCLVNDRPRWHIDIDSAPETGSGKVVPLRPDAPSSGSLVRSTRNTERGGEQGGSTDSES